MDGSNDPSNIIFLSIRDHAIAHAKLYLKHGKYEDYVAFKGLKKQIGKDQIYIETSRIGGLNNKNQPKSLEHRLKISKSNSKPRKRRSKETKLKISQAMKGNKNSNKHSTNKYKKTQSEAMKKSWAKRKNK
jgi:hypothetical protein